MVRYLGGETVLLRGCMVFVVLGSQNTHPLRFRDGVINLLFSRYFA